MCLAFRTASRPYWEYMQVLFHCHDVSSGFHNTLFLIVKNGMTAQDIPPKFPDIRVRAGC